jgi:hypothetical protein
MIPWLFMVVVALSMSKNPWFLFFGLGIILWVLLRIDARTRRLEEQGHEDDSPEEEETGWHHEECGADMEHDEEFCPECGEEVNTFTDSDGVVREGLPMWKLGDN